MLCLFFKLLVLSLLLLCFVADSVCRILSVGRLVLFVC